MKGPHNKQQLQTLFQKKAVVVTVTKKRIYQLNIVAQSVKNNMFELF